MAADVLASMAVVIGANTAEFEKALTQASSSLQKSAKQMQAIGTSMSKYITLPMIGIGAVSLKMAEDLDKSLREVNSLFGETGAAAESSFKDISTQVNLLSQNLGVAQETLSKGLYQAISAGVPKDNIFDFMTVASKAAIAGVTSTETAVDGLTTIINAFEKTYQKPGRWRIQCSKP